MDKGLWDTLTENQKRIMIRLVQVGYCIRTDLGPEFCVLEDAPGLDRADVGLDCAITVEEIKKLEELGLLEETTLGWEPTPKGERLVKIFAA